MGCKTDNGSIDKENIVPLAERTNQTIQQEQEQDIWVTPALEEEPSDIIYWTRDLSADTLPSQFRIHFLSITDMFRFFDFDPNFPREQILSLRHVPFLSNIDLPHNILRPTIWNQAATQYRTSEFNLFELRKNLVIDITLHPEVNPMAMKEILQSCKHVQAWKDLNLDAIIPWRRTTTTASFRNLSFVIFLDSVLDIFRFIEWSPSFSLDLIANLKTVGISSFSLPKNILHQEIWQETKEKFLSQESAKENKGKERIKDKDDDDGDGDDSQVGITLEMKSDIDTIEIKEFLEQNPFVAKFRHFRTISPLISSSSNL